MRLTLVLTHQCDLACTYCYEYGEDKIVDTQYGKQPKFMSEDTAEESVEFLLLQSGSQPKAHLTFFGGETLLNFPVLQKTVAYARRMIDLGADFVSVGSDYRLLMAGAANVVAEFRAGESPEDSGTTY